VSSRRDPNQPSSSTKRSTPTRAARSASAVSFVEVVVEVHRLPRVDEHRARRGGVARPGPQVAVELLVAGEAVGGVHRDDLGRAVRLARFERDLAGVQQLAELEVAPAVGQPLGEPRVVAAPGEVGAPHLAGPLAEAGSAGEHQRWVFVAGAAAPVLDRSGAVGHASRTGCSSRVQRPVKPSSSARRARRSGG
jgi:hypothetical protein